MPHDPLPPRSSHRWKVLAVGVAANAAFAAALGGIPTTALFMRTDYRLDTAALGLALGLLGLGVAVSELPWGLLTDRLGDRRVLLGGLGSTALALAMMALFLVPAPDHVPSAMALGLGLLLVGMLGGSVNGASGRAIMAWFREGERGLAMSIRQTAVPVGGGLGALVLPWLAASHGFAAVFGALSLFSLVTSVAAWLWLHEAPMASGPAIAVPAAPLGNLQVWRVAAAIGLLCFPQIAVLTFATLFLHDLGASSLVAISGSMAAVQIGAAVARVWSGRWTDRRGNRRGYLRGCGLATMLLFLVLAALPASPSWPAIGVLVLGGICASAWHGVAFTELATLAGAGRAGTALGLGNSFAFAAFFLTPLAIPPLLDTGSWALVWLGAAGCALAAIPMFPEARRS